MPALISDIHGNLEALNAVLSHIGDMEIICLGDVVCYGPDSIECVRKSASWSTVIAGALDLSLLQHDANQWNPTINAYIAQLRERFAQVPDKNFLEQTLKSYRREFTANGFRFFHGTPRSTRDWIFPEEIHCPSKLDKHAGHSQAVYIGGGSHIPGIFRRNHRQWEFISPEAGKAYDLTSGEKMIATIGSVGQPRDGDSRAAFAIVDNTSIVFHRVEYDMETTRRKINDDPDADNTHGDRLPNGR